MSRHRNKRKALLPHCYASSDESDNPEQSSNPSNSTPASSDPLRRSTREKRPRQGYSPDPEPARSSRSASKSANTTLGSVVQNNGTSSANTTQTRNDLESASQILDSDRWLTGAQGSHSEVLFFHSSTPINDAIGDVGRVTPLPEASSSTPLAPSPNNNTAQTPTQTIMPSMPVNAPTIITNGLPNLQAPAPVAPSSRPRTNNRPSSSATRPQSSASLPSVDGFARPGRPTRQTARNGYVVTPNDTFYLGEGTDNKGMEFCFVNAEARYVGQPYEGCKGQDEDLKQYVTFIQSFPDHLSATSEAGKWASLKHRTLFIRTNNTFIEVPAWTPTLTRQEQIDSSNDHRQELMLSELTDLKRLVLSLRSDLTQMKSSIAQLQQTVQSNAPMADFSLADDVRILTGLVSQDAIDEITTLFGDNRELWLAGYCKALFTRYQLLLPMRLLPQTHIDEAVNALAIQFNVTSRDAIRDVRKAVTSRLHSIRNGYRKALRSPHYDAMAIGGSHDTPYYYKKVDDKYVCYIDKRCHEGDVAAIRGHSTTYKFGIPDDEESLFICIRNEGNVITVVYDQTTQTELVL